MKMKDPKQDTIHPDVCENKGGRSSSENVTASQDRFPIRNAYGEIVAMAYRQIGDYTGGPIPSSMKGATPA